MVQWWNAWMSWWDGQGIQNRDLWGLPIYIWGRFGKLTEFVAGLVVVLDLIDKHRLHDWGRRANQRLRERDRLGFWWWGVFKGSPLRRVVMILLVHLLFIGGTVFLYRTIGIGEISVLVWVLIWLPLASPFFVAILQLFASALLELFSGLPLLIGVVIGKPLDRERPGHPLRWLALTMFVVGFHFDLLAS